LSVGTEIIHLRRITPQIGIGSELDLALAEFAQGSSVAARARLAKLDRRLASLPASHSATSVAVRVRSRLLSVCDALAQHRPYFDAGEFG